MSLVDLSDAQDRAGASVTQDMIDEEEAWLASQVGPLTGERTETFYLPSRLYGTVDAVYLSRRTDSVDGFTSDGDALSDYRLVSNYIVERNFDAAEAWSDPLVVTYTPNDVDLVTGVIYDLLTFRSLPSNLQSIRIGAYSETYGTGGGASTVRRALVGRVLTSAGLGAYGLPFRFKHTAIDRSVVEATGS